MNQSLEEIMREGNNRHYSIHFETYSNHVMWWIFKQNSGLHWSGSKGTIEEAKQDLYNQLVRLP